MSRVADVIFEFLSNRGAAHVFLVPGGGAMHLVDAVGQCEAVQAVPTHHEQAAVIAAEAYGRIQGRLGCALVTTGPGVTNAITPVTGAWIDSIPLFIISGQVKRADLMGDSGVRQMGPQEVNVKSLADGITKYCVTIDDASSIRYHLERAYFEAHHGRPGPVWIDVPLDIQASEVDFDSLAGFTAPPAPARVDDATMQQLLDWLSIAEKPLIFAGHGVRLSGAVTEFQALVKQLNIPVVTTWNAMDLLAFDDPCYVGKPGSVAMRAPNFAIQNCDLLIAMGTRLDNVVTAFNPAGFAGAAKKVLIDVDPAELKKLGDTIDLPVAAELQTFIPDLISALAASPAKHPDSKKAEAWRVRCEAWKQKYQVNDYGHNERISHYEFVEALSNAIPEDTLISTGSSGLGIEVFYSAFKSKAGQRVFLTSGLGAMGYGLPAAIGACLGGGAKPMIAIESDGSLQLNLQELNTLKALNLPIRLFILNNGGYGSIRTTQRNYFDGRYVGTGPEAGLFIPDFGKLAAVYDFPYIKIENTDSLEAHIETVLGMPGPVICDVLLQENEGLRPKVSAIVQPDGSMISMPLEDMTPLLTLEEMQEIMGDNLSQASLDVTRD